MTMLWKEMHFCWNYACEMAVHVATYTVLIPELHVLLGHIYTSSL